MKTLVTGGAGFIGSHLVDKLIDLGNEVVVIDNFFTGRKKNLNKKSKFYNLDIRDKSISSVFKKEKPEVVFHYAAQTSVKRALNFPIQDLEINVLGSLNILEASKVAKVQKFVFISSAAVYGDPKKLPLEETSVQKPISFYGAAKLAVENYLNCYKELNPVILRYSNVYGPRQQGTGEAGVVAIFLENILNNKAPIIFGGKQTRDFLYVSDAVQSAIFALKAKPQTIFNVSTNKETNIISLFKILAEKTNKNITPRYFPLPAGEIKKSRVSSEKIKKELKFSPYYNLDAGLEKTINWFLFSPKKNY